MADSSDGNNIPILHTDWHTLNNQSLERHFSVRNFDEALRLANLCASIAATLTHHPDLRIGWGYCDIKLTTHSKKSLTELDFRFAAMLDQLMTTLEYTP